MKKDLLILFAVILALAVFLGGSEILSVEEYYLIHIDDIEADSQTVFISIDCREILSHPEKLDPALWDYVPENGMILEKTEYVLRPGDTAFDLLRRTVRANRIQMEYQGAQRTAYGAVYIQGINHIYEFSCGSESGWTFRVNGEYPDYGASAVPLSDGDWVEWVYTCALDRIV